MKQTFHIGILLLFSSCNRSAHTETHTDSAFDTRSYELSQFTRRVETFLRTRMDIPLNLSSQALFVHTENCSNCTRNAFNRLFPYLKRTSKPTCIYINDSTFMTETGNPKVRFVYLPTDKYKSSGVYHSQMYLYAVNGKIRPIALNLQHIDSLNLLIQ